MSNVLKILFQYILSIDISHILHTAFTKEMLDIKDVVKYISSY